MSSVPPTPTASCYICLENGTENGTLLRNCACRGDAGWVHVACLAKYAANKVVDVRKKDPHCNYINVLKYWNTCLLCKTPFMQNMGFAMASACVQQYEHQQNTAEMRLISLHFMASVTYDSGDYDGALGLYNRLVEICEEKTREGFDMRLKKADYLVQISQVFMRKNRKNDALAALEKVELHGPDSSIMQKKLNFLKAATKKIGGGSIQRRGTAETLVLARRRFKKDRKASSDNEDGRFRIACYSKLISALNIDGKYQEAMEQYENMVSESRRILGPDHPDTLNYEDNAEKYRMQMKPGGSFYHSAAEGAVVAATSKMELVWAVVDCDQKPSISGKRVKVVRAAKDAGKYICLIENHEGVVTKFKALHNQFILEKGTKVVVHGLISSTDLNGSTGIICSFNREKQRYAVKTRKKSTVLIKSSNLNIVFFV